MFFPPELNLCLHHLTLSACHSVLFPNYFPTHLVVLCKLQDVEKCPLQDGLFMVFFCVLFIQDMLVPSPHRK